jgi:cytochrome c biogenesis protein CcdA
MARLWRVTLMVVLLTGLALVGTRTTQGQSDPPKVGIFVFHSPQCPACQVALKEFIPSLQEQYPGQLEARTFDLTMPENDATLKRFEEVLETQVKLIPTVIIGQEILQGTEVWDRLPVLVAEALEKGGLDFPSRDLPVAPSGAPPLLQPELRPLIHLAYFHQTGCQQCDLVQLELQWMAEEYPELMVRTFDIGTPEAKALYEVLGRRTGIPEEKRLVTPAVFIGEDALVGKEVNAANLQRLVFKYQETGAEPIWEEESLAEGTQSIVHRFRSFGVLAVLAAGLIDGLNPCAFATIAFLVGYLSLSRHRQSEILLAGLSFTLGVLITYFLAGIGILKLVERLQTMASVARGIYLATAAGCFALGLMSLYDYYQSRQGRPEAMRLRLPKRLQELSRQVMREGTRLRAYLPVTFGLGLVISMLEFACTGQVYLPTIVFVVGRPELRARALLYLGLYNILFVAPLMVVFILAYWGTTSRRVLGFTRQHLGTTKLLTAAVFLGLGVWLLLA